MDFYVEKPELLLSFTFVENITFISGNVTIKQNVLKF